MIKESSRTHNATRNILWGIINKIVTILLPFATRTVMIYTMGMDYVGLGSLFSSVLQVLSLAELGFGSAVVYSMYKPVAEKDVPAINALLCFYKKTYRVVGLFILCLGVIITPFLDYFIEGDIPSDISIYALFLMYLVNNLISYFVFGYKQAILSATQRVDLISKVGLLLQFICSAFQITALIILKNIYVYTIVIPIITLLNNLALGYITNKYYPEFRAEGKLNIEDSRELIRRVGGLAIQKLGNIVLSSVDTIVISSYLGLTILGVYNGYYYIITALFAFLAVIWTGVVPSIGNMLISNSVEQNYTAFKTFHFLYLWIIMWWSSCLLCLYQPFIRMWQGKENMLSMNVVIALCIYFFVYKMGDMSGIFKESLGLWWENKLVPLISSGINLTLNLILVRYIGLLGIVLSTIIAIAFVNVPFGGIVLFDKYFKDRKKFLRYLSMILICFLSALITSVGTFCICCIVKGDGVGAFLIKCVICVFVPNVILLLIHIKNPDFVLALNFVRERFFLRKSEK